MEYASSWGFYNVMHAAGAGCVLHVHLLTCLCCFGIARPLLCLDTASPARRVPDARVDSRPLAMPMIDGTDLRFTRPTGTDELSQTKAGQIVQGKAPGFMWIGTAYGLNRFDGYTLKLFVHEQGNPDTLAGTAVHSLFTDRDGVLWVGCDQFLNKFNRLTETFTPYPIPFVADISQDSTGLLWLATGTGLYSLDPGTRRVYHYTHEANDPSSLSSDEVKSSGEDRRGRFWVATSEGLDQFDRKTGKVVLRIPVREPSDILSFYEDRFGVFWIFQVSSDALAVFDRNTNTVTHYSLQQPGSSSSALTGVTGMVEDHAGNLWVATHGAGLLKFDRAHRRFISYRNDPTVPDSLPQDDVECLFVDHQGSIWAGLGSKGLVRFSTTPKPFRLLPHGLGNPNATRNPFIGAIYGDGQGTLWVGTPDAVNGISASGKYTCYRRIAGPGARTDAITIREDRAHNLWVGTYGHGLLRFDTRTGKFRTYRHEPGNPYSLSDNFVSRLLVDHNGTLWAASAEALNRFDPAADRFTSYRPSPQNKSLFYLDLVEDSHNALWLGTHSSGVARFDPVSGQFTNFYHHDLKRSGTLSDSRVNSIYFDRAGTMWVGTQNGLDKFDSKTGKFIVFSRRNGLPGNVVGCILEDGHNHLWMSTNNGVASFDKNTQAIRTYSTADGLPGPDLTGWGACFKSPTGELFFGGFSGAVAFYPDAAASYPQASIDTAYTPPVVLTEFRLSGRQVEIGHGSPLATSISYTRKLTLDHHQTSFSLAFSELSYVNPRSIRYRYKLDGLEEAWHEVDGNERLATYTTVPAGTYTFRIQAATPRGLWSIPGLALEIRILPPIWQSDWFLIGCVALILFSVWMLYLARIRRLAYGLSLRLEERVDERTRIARELHDTLLQSFHGLMLRLEVIYKLLPEGKAKEQLEKTMERADQAIAEGRSAVYALRSSAMTTNDLSEAVTAVGNELSEGNDAAFTLLVEGAPRNLHPIIRDEFYRIAREALHNAFKHADARHIEAEISYGNHVFRLRIRDDGEGIPAEILEQGRPGHYGLPGIRERARQLGAELNIWSRAGMGTEIELSLAGSIAYAQSPRRSHFLRFRKKVG